jgi:carbon-monoxide dehydrogenase medium subunit
VFPGEFEYYRATSVEDAIKLLGEHPDSKIIAGGHSLLPAMKLRLAVPSALVDIGRIESLRGVSANGGVTIGALTTYQELEDSEDLRNRLPIIAETANVVGDPQVRARGTLGGSLAHSDPAADFTAVILALGGSVKAVGPSGERTISADELFVDLLTTSLAENEVITQIQIPSASGEIGMAYEKHAHPASGYAVVGVAAVLGNSNGTCQSARIAVTGATSKATRATAAEQAIIGQPLNADSIANAASVAADGLEINGEIYASAEYRTHLVRVYTKRALTRAAGL